VRVHLLALLLDGPFKQEKGFLPCALSPDRLLCLDLPAAGIASSRRRAAYDKAQEQRAAGPLRCCGRRLCAPRTPRRSGSSGSRGIGGAGTVPAWCSSASSRPTPTARASCFSSPSSSERTTKLRACVAACACASGQGLDEAHAARRTRLTTPSGQITAGKVHCTILFMSGELSAFSRLPSAIGENKSDISRNAVLLLVLSLDGP